MFASSRLPSTLERVRIETQLRPVHQNGILGRLTLATDYKQVERTMAQLTELRYGLVTANGFRWEYVL